MRIVLVLVLVLAAAVFAQDDPAAGATPSQPSAAQASSAQELADKMLSASVAIFGMVQENGHLVQATQGAGFFLDPQTLVTSAVVCCTRIKGQMPQPKVVVGTQSAFAKVTWSSAEDGLALLHLEQPFGGDDPPAGVSVVPSKFTHAGQPVFAVQFPGPGEATLPEVATGELQDLAPVDGVQGSVFHTSAPINAFNAGGALFDACGNAVAVNWKSADGTQYAFPLDALLEQLDNAGSSDKIADGPCASNPDQAASTWWRLPLGSQWIAIVVMLVMLGGLGLWLGKKNSAAKK
jgi:S1-C subfamily serine protease